MKTTADLIIRLRWVIISLFIIITVVFALQIPRAQIDSNVKNMLPLDMPSRVLTDRIEDLFGGTEMIMIMLVTDDVLNPETLKRVKTLTRKMKRVEGVEKVLSLFELKNIRGEEGAMIVDPAVDVIPRSDEEREILRREIRDNDIVFGNVVAKDFSATAVIGLLDTEVSDVFIVKEATRIAAETPGSEETVIGGLPLVRVSVSKDIQGDLRRLMPFALIIMLVFLFISFKQLRGVLLPFIVVVMSILFCIGLMPVLGWKIMIITSTLPVILIAVANDYGIHLIARYQEINTAGSGLGKKELAKDVFRSLSKPILAAGLTTVAGMLCLMGHVLIPARQLGILAAVGITFALGASLLFLPALLSFLPIAKPVVITGGANRKTRLLERLLVFFGRTISSFPRTIVAVIVILTIISAAGIFLVEVDTNPSNYYSGESPVVKADKLANDKFGGSTSISVIYQGDIKDPVIMHRIEGLEDDLRELPEVGNTVSIARTVRQMSRALNDEGDSLYNRIPNDRNAIAQYFMLYSMSGDPDDFEKLVDFPYEHAQLTARIKEISSREINRVVDYVRDMTSGDENVEAVGGFATILGELAELIVRGQVISLCIALVVVSLLIMILFRSVTAGLISIIPLGISMVILFGLMGFFGIELNIATALMSSIMIGVGIDYTIHFLWRYREERKTGLDPQTGVKQTLTTTGRGIVFNAFSVIVGFTALMISNFIPVRFFGFLVIVSIGSCLMGALILIPSLCLVFKPKFLEPK